MRNAVLIVGLAALAAAPVALAKPDQSHAHHHPIDRSGRPQVGKASFYGARQAGRTTASGKPLKPTHLTAASKTLPLGTQAKVIDKDTGKSVRVTVTDRGPFKKGRILDLSPKAAEKLGMKDDGVAQVKVVPLKEPASP